MATSSAALPQSKSSAASRRRFPVRKRWVALAVAAAIAVGFGWLWFQDSSFVAVQDVTVTGAHGANAAQIRHALTNAAQDMTTLDFDAAAIRSAAAPYPSVKAVEVQTHFPHKATIVVHEYVPVGTVTMAGANVPVAADGTLLRGTRAPDVPPLTVTEPIDGDRVETTSVLAQVHVMAGATPAQRRLVQHIGSGPHGVEVELRGAPDAWFGAGTDARDKWISYKRVVADPAAQGTAYIDLRVPARPAAGGFAGDASAGDPSGSTDSTTDDGTP